MSENTKKEEVANAKDTPVEGVAGEEEAEPVAEATAHRDVVGLDFGSLKVAMAIHRAKAEFPEMVRNELSNRTTPASIVFSSDGARLIGEPAELVKTRGGAITDVKARVQEDGATMPEVTFQGEKHSLQIPHLICMLFSRLGNDVARFAVNNALDEAPEGPRTCMVAVPKAFSDEQNDQVRHGLELADYTVLGSVYDISCAALLYAHRMSKTQADKEPQTVLFVDVGHDFVSAQVVQVDAANATLKVLATASKSHCGAAAYSQVLVKLWKDTLKAKHKVDVDALPEQKRERALMRLTMQAEKAKGILSGLAQTHVTVDSVVPELDFNTSISRVEMEAGATEVTQGLKELLEQVVAEAQLDGAATVQRVELIGGGSRIPCVQAVVSDIFECGVSKTLDNECTVALGAALFAARAEGSVQFTVEGEFGPAPPKVNEATAWTPDTIELMRTLESRMRAADEEVTARNDAKNQLETFIFDHRRETSEQTVGVDDEAALDQMRAILTAAEDWIYEDGETAEARVVEEKLATLREECKAIAPKLFANIQKREEKAREDRLKAAQEVLQKKPSDKKKHMRPSEKIAMAKSKKEHGTQLVRDSNWEDATRRYSQALSLCAEMDGTLSPEDQKQVDDIKFACYLNLCLGNIRLKLPKLGVHNATKAIEMRPEHPKGYLRRAQAHFETKDYEEAKKDLLLSKKYDADDTIGWGKFMAKTEHALKVQREKQKKAYGNMFK